MAADALVIDSAARFLTMIGGITSPSDIYFRSFANEGVEGLARLCEAASARALGGSGAMASLVIAPGDVSSFSIDGAHARATLQHMPRPGTRLVVLSILLIVTIVVAMVCARHPR